MPLEDFFESMCVMNWISKPDGLGSFVWEWEEGVPFEDGIVLNTSTPMQLAQQTGSKGIYALTTSISMPFENGDVVKRMRDGSLFQITSDPEDAKTPALSDVKGVRVTMERVVV